MINVIQGLPPIVITNANQLQTEEGERNPVETENRASARKNNSTEDTLRAIQKSKDNAESDNKTDFAPLEAKIKNFLELDDVTLKFTKDKETNEMILKIIDPDTEEVIRQIPSELSLKIARFVAKEIDHGQVTDAKI